jgi:hypothetical protein
MSASVYVPLKSSVECMYPLRDKTYQKVTPWLRDEVREFVACSEVFEVVKNAKESWRQVCLHGKAEKPTRGCKTGLGLRSKTLCVMASDWQSSCKFHGTGSSCMLPVLPPYVVKKRQSSVEPSRFVTAHFDIR